LENEKVHGSGDSNVIPLFSGRFRTLVQIGLVLSSLLGYYILMSSQPVAVLAGSGEYGILAISGIDLLLAFLLTFPRFYGPGVGSAVLMTTIQLGVLFSSSQFGSPIITAYSFGLLAFDAYLVTQFTVGIASHLATRRQSLLSRIRAED
jgi:hypothetical protein